MRVLFIYPNLDSQEGFNHGIAALSGYLRHYGHETRLINLNEAIEEPLSNQQIFELVCEWQTDLVAFSTMTPQFRHAVEIAHYIRERRPDIPFVIGGIHVTMDTESVIEAGIFEYIGVGECDEALAELVNRLQVGEPVDDVQNFYVRQADGSYQRNSLRPYPILDELPPKHYDIFDLDTMLRSKVGWMSILTSRGCPYRCTYCFNHEVTDRYRAEGGHLPKTYLRHYAIDRIIGEMKALKERYGDDLNTFIIDDDLFTLNKSYVYEFCEAYKASGIRTPFVVNAHVQTFDDDIARALRNAGCKVLKFGLESGSKKMRYEVLKRWMTNEDIIRAFSQAHAAGLHTSAFVMIGLPTETPADLWESVNLLARITPGRYRWAIYFPFVGTASYTMCKDQELIDWQRMNSLHNYYVASCLKFDAEMDELIRRMRVCFNWYVNARSDFPCKDLYAELVAETESLTLEAFEARVDEWYQRDRELSDELLAKDIPHYSIRYTKVMGVHSDFVKWENNREWSSLDVWNDLASAAIATDPDRQQAP